MTRPDQRHARRLTPTVPTLLFLLLPRRHSRLRGNPPCRCLLACARPKGLLMMIILPLVEKLLDFLQTNTGGRL